MKKLITFALVFAMGLSMIGCGCNHQWEEATCTSPKTCTLCGKTEGEVGNHTPGELTITAVDTGKTMTFKVVGSQESNFKAGAISEDSPVGKALKGARVGQTVVVEAPRGSMRYTVDKIER